MLAQLCLALLLSSAVCMEEEENIYIKKSEIEDQEQSASSYAYQLQSGPAGIQATYPQQFQYYNQLGYPPITIGRYSQEVPLQLPIQGQYQPQPEPIQNNIVNSYGLPLQGYGLQQPLLTTPPLVQQYHQPLQQPLVQPQQPLLVPLAEVGKKEQGESFSKGGGSAYGAQNHNAHGEKGSEGYNSAHKYDKGAKGHHDSEAQKGHYNLEGGHKEGHQDAASHYNQKQEAAKGSQGGSFHNKKGHKKGSKTSGYHRVEHKDEYKKDHTFYDESDASGHYNKYGEQSAKHGSEGGQFKKGGSEEGGYQQEEKGAKGFVDKGHYDKKDSGFKGQQGEEGHYKEFKDYAKKGGQEEAKEQGFKEQKSYQQ